MNRTGVAILAITALVVVAATVAFGWPGWLAITALAPGLLIGTALTNALDAAVGIAPFRPMRVVLGLTLGSLLSIVALLLMWAATAPEEIVLEHVRSVDVPPDEAWTIVEDVSGWPRWDLLVTDTEGAPRAPEVGARFTTSLHLVEHTIPAETVVDAWTPPSHARWRIELPQGSALQGLTKEVAIAPEGSGSRLTYRLVYRLTSVAARAVHRVTLEGELSNLVTRSADGLASVISGAAGG